MIDKVALVTGSNQGIGFGIVRELCRRGVKTVYLTSRDVSIGRQVAEKLEKEGLNPSYHQLDVTSIESVQTLANHLKEQHGGLDILINNAGVISADYNNITYEDAKRVIQTNYGGLLIIQKYLFPVLKDNARVVNISSSCGHLSNIKNRTWIERLSNSDMKLEDIDAFVNWFLCSIKNGTLEEKDFLSMFVLPYTISKVAVSALTRLQQNEAGRGISVNSLHPGFVRTNMTRNNGLLTIDEAAESPVFLALDVDQSVKGRYFWFDKTEKDWADVNAPLPFQSANFIEVSSDQRN